MYLNTINCDYKCKGNAFGNYNIIFIDKLC